VGKYIKKGYYYLRLRPASSSFIVVTMTTSSMLS
jgi:hypothetical protein